MLVDTSLMTWQHIQSHTFLMRDNRSVITKIFIALNFNIQSCWSPNSLSKGTHAFSQLSMFRAGMLNNLKKSISAVGKISDCRNRRLAIAALWGYRTLFSSLASCSRLSKSYRGIENEPLGRSLPAKVSKPLCNSRMTAQDSRAPSACKHTYLSHRAHFFLGTASAGPAK